MLIDQIDKNLLDLANQSDEILKDIYKEIDDICFYNSNRILSSFIENNVSYSDFSDINGYGNYDEGRDKLEKIFSTVLGCAVLAENASSRKSVIYPAYFSYPLSAG